MRPLFKAPIKNNSVKLGGVVVYFLYPQCCCGLKTDGWGASPQSSLPRPSLLLLLAQPRGDSSEEQEKGPAPQKWEQKNISPRVISDAMFNSLTKGQLKGGRGLLNLQFWVAVHHWGKSRQGFKAGRLAIPHSITSDQGTHSQSKKYSRSYGERYLLAFPKENKGWERRGRGDQEAQLLELLKDFPRERCLFVILCMFTCVFKYIRVCWAWYIYTYMYTNVRKILGIIPQELSHLVMWDR